MLVTMATHGANKDACFGGSVDLVVAKKMGFLTSQIDMIYITHNIIYYNITCKYNMQVQSYCDSIVSSRTFNSITRY